MATFSDRNNAGNYARNGQENSVQAVCVQRFEKESSIEKSSLLVGVVKSKQGVVWSNVILHD